MTPVPGASVALAHRLAPDLVGPPDGDSRRRERPITVDQTNASVVVDETVIVKWFDPPIPHPHPGLELLAHLADLADRSVVDPSIGGRGDGAVVPHLFGVEIVDGAVVATASEFVIGAVDGWEWFVDELLSGTGASEQWSSRIGSLAARLHADLATPSPVFPEPVATVSVRPEQQRCDELLRDAGRIGTPEVRAVLAPRLDAITAAIGELAGIDTTTGIRIHDDLHVGQVLRSGDRLVVTDFDGNPIGAAGFRGRPRPAAVDVASLVQSVDHAGRVAIRRAPDRADAIGTEIGSCTAALLDAYRSGLAARGRADLLDERLVEPLRYAQELHELVYADRHLPRWAYAPLATLVAMLPDRRPAR